MAGATVGASRGAVVSGYVREVSVKGITSGAAKGSAIWLGAIAVQAGQKPRIGEGRTAHVENNFSNDAIVAQARIDHDAGRNCSWNCQLLADNFFDRLLSEFSVRGCFPVTYRVRTHISFDLYTRSKAYGGRTSAKNG